MERKLIMLGFTAFNPTYRLSVVHVPAQGLEERIEELLPKLRVVVLAGPVGLAVPLEAFDKIKNFPGAGGRNSARVLFFAH